MQQTEPLYEDVPSCAAPVMPVPVDAALRRDAERLPRSVRLGGCGWGDESWRGTVYAPASGGPAIRMNGLAAYARHPMMRCVSLERNYLRPFELADYLRMAEAVPEDFRFVVRAPAGLTDPYRRDRRSRILGGNTEFLDAQRAVSGFMKDAHQGLGSKCGVFLFDFAPHAPGTLRDPAVRTETQDRLLAFLREVSERNISSAAVGAELHDALLLTPRFIKGLKEAGVRPVLGLNAEMPGILRQIRALCYYETNGLETADWLFSGPCLIRWSRSAALSRTHLKDGLDASDPFTRAAVVGLVLRALRSKEDCYVLAGDRAEGNAPATLRAVLNAVLRQLRAP